MLNSTQTTPTTGGTDYPFVYTYNLAGELSTEKYPSLKVINFTYDEIGRLNKVDRTGGPTYASNLMYTAPGARQSMTLGNGLINQTTYNSRLEPTSIQLGTSSNASSVLELDYRFNSTQAGTPVADNNGNVLEQTIKIGSNTVADQTYTYDQVNRIKVASETSGGSTSWMRTYSYDVYGNMCVPLATASGIMPGSQTPTDLSNFNSNNQLTLGSSGYDPAGNLMTDPDGDHITYDAENRMTTFTASNNNLEGAYSYDGNGNRISKQVTTIGQMPVTTTYVYNAMGQLIAEYGGSGPTTTGTSYLTTDHLGSTRVITDSTSPTPNVLERDDYLPFGEQIDGTKIGTGRSGVTGYSSSTDIHQKFTSKERDTESGLDFFDARYFSSAQGRFTSPDEFTGGPVDLFDFADDASANPMFYADTLEPQSLNKYQYCYNNPLRYLDANGHGIGSWLKQEAIEVGNSIKDTGIGMAKSGANMVIGTAGLVNSALNVGLSTVTSYRLPIMQPYKPTTMAQHTAMISTDVATLVVGGGEGLVGDASEVGKTVETVSKASEAKGGTYILRDAETGEVVRTGRTNDLARRQGEHARSSETAQYKFEVDKRTDNYAAQRGREQIIHDQYKPRMNKIRPIRPNHPKRAHYMREGRRL